jgi:hypothetical protein
MNSGPSEAPPAFRLCSEAGSRCRRAAAEVALTSAIQQFQMETAIVGQTGPAAGRKAVSCRRAGAGE